MDPRLEEASYNGDLDALYQLLQEDRFLLERLRLSTTSCVPNNPLHIAALLGHTDFARVILHLKPGLAKDSNGHGFLPLHLAAANGHLPIVRELLGSKLGTDLCLLRGENGLLPIHTAAIKGRVPVLEELLDACSESARLRTCQEDTVLHLAVNANCSQVVEFLVERFDDDGEFLNAKDAKGNTILHLAMARRRLQIAKFLLSKRGIHVNSVNSRGFTPLDVLLESPREHDDLILAEMIRVAGGETTARNEARPATEQNDPSEGDCSTWAPLLRLTSSLNKRMWKDGENSEGILMALASLIATITIQGGLNPPGGFDQENGKAVLASKLSLFLEFDMLGLFTSLGTLLLLMCVAPRRKRMVMKFLVSMMRASVFSTALAFSVAMFQIFPESAHPAVLTFLNGWLWIFRVAVIWVALRFSMYLLRKAGWFKKEEEDCGRAGAKRIAAALVVIAVAAAVIFVSTVKLPIWFAMMGLPPPGPAFSDSVPTPATPRLPAPVPHAASSSEPFHPTNRSRSDRKRDRGLRREKKPETLWLSFPAPHSAFPSEEDSEADGN